MRASIEHIVKSVLLAADPARAVRGVLAGRVVEDPHVALLAVGKAAIPMADAALKSLTDRVDAALVLSTPRADRAPPCLTEALRTGRAQVLEADHPVPTHRNLEAAQRILHFLTRTTPQQTLLLALSGGASALLCLPRSDLALADLAAITDALLRAGAPIEELNAVRRHCEVLKGGGLAAAGAGAERIVALILSDVIGDRLDVIASGPTAPDPTTFADALAVLQGRALLDTVPPITAHLRRGAAGAETETLKPDNPIWSRVRNLVIGNNRLALDAACAEAARRAYPTLDRQDGVQGEAADVGRRLARSALAVARAGPARACIAWGGETTVTVGPSPGRGGRNQELALAAAIALEGTQGVTILSFATDGRDGPTDAAGAVVDGSTCARIRAAGLDPAAALARHDSHGALDAAGALLRTGPTGTNVNDLMLALVG